MPLSWNEIKDRALHFTKEWEGESRERAEKDSFYNDFFEIFGKKRRSIAIFERNAVKLNGNTGFIDLFWKGHLIVEHKSLGQDLDKAFHQAAEYFSKLDEDEKPRYILVCDFENFHLTDLDKNETHKFTLSELHKKIKLFGFIAGYQERTYKEEDPVNRKAAERMARLHEQLEENGYSGTDLQVMLVRLLFCLFAEDTGIFSKDLFAEFIETKTREDGSDLGGQLQHLFQVLDTPIDKRQSNLDEMLNEFPYVNGRLFEINIRMASFSSGMRIGLLWAASMDWGQISPAIFGSMFQGVMDPAERRNLGAHYTSEKNIMKLIGPLFLDELKEEFASLKKLRGGKGKEAKLKAYHEKLGTLKFLDPACGCGNFLIITYRELRLLEIEVQRELYKGGQQFIDVNDILKVDVDQFYGIEYDEWPAKIAELALWLMDHQMNLRISEEFGMYYARLPLKKAATIIHGNALRIDWEEVVPKSELSYIMGNPPFIGHQWRTKEQQGDMDLVFGLAAKTKRLDYVASWFYKAAIWSKDTNHKIAFVATNSICQGEQVEALWGRVFGLGFTIRFAHETFNWSNDAKGKAKVHVIIVGFDSSSSGARYIFYNDGDRIQRRLVEKINGYLIEANNFFIKNRGLPMHENPPIKKGSQPTDGGNLVLSPAERDELLHSNEHLAPFIRKYIGGAELIRGKDRYCLWLKNCPPELIRSSALITERLQRIRDIRLSSPTKSVNEFAQFPALFTQDRQPEEFYLAVPEVSSKNRLYIPIGYLSSEVICSNQLQIIPDASLFLFGVLLSLMHNSWMRRIAGRLKSDYRYSPAVYNNLPWPKTPTPAQKKKVEACAQAVLAAREQFPDSSLADLYDPLSMPPVLLKAHQALDKAVDKCYRKAAFKSETERIEFLFELYGEYVKELDK